MRCDLREVTIEAVPLVAGCLLVPVIFLELRQVRAQRESDIESAAASHVLGQSVNPFDDVPWKSHGDDLPRRVTTVSLLPRQPLPRAR
jgi:hypothetical protein